MNKFWIVLSHTYANKVRSKAFIFSTIIMIVALAAFTNFDKITSLFTDDTPANVAVIDKTGDTLQPLKQQMDESGNPVNLVAFTGSESAAKKAVDDETYDGYLIITEDAKGMPAATYKAPKITDEETTKALQQTLQQVKVMAATKMLGLQPEKVAEVYAPVSFEKVALKKGAKTQDEIFQATMLVYIVNLIIYISILSFGSMIAMEIATEKSSRVMELLISSVPPVTQMLGKIIGIAFLGITQFVVLFAAVFAISSPGSSGGASKTDMMMGVITKVPISLALYAIVFFLIGYFLFATLFATIGSLVSRIENINQAISPVTMLAVAAFIVSAFGLSAPDSSFITVMSFIPFFTPVVMFLRVGILDVPFWQIAIGIAINLVTIAILLMIGIRVYKGGVLLYGSSSVFRTFKEAMKLTKGEP